MVGLGGQMGAAYFSYRWGIFIHGPARGGWGGKGYGGGVKNLTAVMARSYVLGRVLVQRRWHNNCKHDSEMEPY